MKNIKDIIIGILIILFPFLIWFIGIYFYDSSGVEKGQTEEYYEYHRDINSRYRW